MNLPSAPDAEPPIPLRPPPRSQLMKRLLARCLLPVALLGAAGCNLVTGLGNNCPATYDARYGCVRVVVNVQAPPQPWPDPHRWALHAVPAREGTGLGGNLAARPGPGTMRFHLGRRERQWPGTGDTASVWIVAKLLDDPRPIQVNVPLPVFAADSVLYVADFNRSRVDTVRLTLRRP